MSKRLYIGIDLQDGFLNDAIRESDYEARVEKFLAALDKEQVILTRFVNTPGSSFERFLDWPEMQAGDPSTALLGSLESGGYQVFEKSTYTAWLPAVAEKARSMDAREIVLFGLDSDACVLKTALDVFEAGYVPVVLADLSHSSGGEQRHHAGMKLLRTLIGTRQIIRSDTMPIGA
jgi:nicotinamidase-related amidase